MRTVYAEATVGEDKQVVIRVEIDEWWTIPNTWRTDQGQEAVDFVQGLTRVVAAVHFACKQSARKERGNEENDLRPTAIAGQGPLGSGDGDNAGDGH